MMRNAFLVIAASIVAGCATPPAPPPEPHHVERVILLPHRDGDRPEAVATVGAREHRLSSAYETFAIHGQREVTAQLAKDDVHQRYGELLSSQPAKPLTFVLFYNLMTTELTPDSRGKLSQIKQQIASFPGAEVTVIGHTDTSGTTEYNDALAMSRARAVRDLLIQLGIPGTSIEMVGRGARDPLVKTGAGVREERNRRVEVKLR